MRFIYAVIVSSVVLAALLWPTTSRATHVRAGEITTRRISETSLTYEITLTAYYDEKNGKRAADDATFADFCFGDGTTMRVDRSRRRYINGGTSSVNIYIITHTYPGPGAYTISAVIPNRNKDTKNLPPPDKSEQIKFFVSTTIFINPALGLNSTPDCSTPP